MSKNNPTRDERYELFKKQVDWAGWCKVTRERFDELFPAEIERSITETLGMDRNN